MNFSNTVQKTKILFVSSVPLECTPSQLQIYFRKFGKVSSVRFSKRKSRLNKSSATVKMATYRGFNAALQPKDHELLEQKIKVEPRLTGDQLILKNEDIASRRLYVNMIPFDMEVEQLEAAFKALGDVDVSYIDKKASEDDFSKNYGFITFKTKGDAMRILKMEKIPILGKSGKFLKVAPFKTKSKKLALNNLSIWNEHFKKNFTEEQNGSQTSIQLALMQKMQKKSKADRGCLSNPKMKSYNHLQQERDQNVRLFQKSNQNLKKTRTTTKRAYLINQNTSSNMKIGFSLNSINSIFCPQNPVDGHRRQAKSRVSQFEGQLLKKISYRHRTDSHLIYMNRPSQRLRAAEGWRLF